MHKRSNSTLRRIGVGTLLAGLAASAAAETSPYYIGGQFSYAHESNPLALTDSATGVPNGYVSKSDNVASLALIAGIDQTISRQRVFGDLTLRQSKYDKNKLLDHRSHALTLGLDWQTVARLSGNVTLKSNEDLVSFSSVERPSGSGTNLVRSNLAEASARLGVVTRFTFEGGVGYRSVDYSDSAYDARDYKQNRLWLGGRYSAGGQNYVGVTLRAAEGRYPRFVLPATRLTPAVVGDSYDRRDAQLVLSLEGSGASSLYFQGGYTDFDQAVQNRYDFDGFTGLVRATWLPTGKLRLSAELARDRGQDIAFALDFFGGRLDSAQLATIARLRANWAATAKTEVHTSLIVTQRSVIQAQPAFGIEATGRERALEFALGASWTPTRTSRIGCDYTQRRRRADLFADLLNVTGKSTSCFAQLTLQP